MTRSHQPGPPGPVCLPYRPTDPDRVKIYGVTEKGTRNGWQGTVSLWAWPVHESESHTKWATPRAPLPDSHGLGEISSTPSGRGGIGVGLGGHAANWRTESASQWTTHGRACEARTPTVPESLVPTTTNPRDHGKLDSRLDMELSFTVKS
jgi:hypothetical protein